MEEEIVPQPSKELDDVAAFLRKRIDSLSVPFQRKILLELKELLDSFSQEIGDEDDKETAVIFRNWQASTKKEPEL